MKSTRKTNEIIKVGANISDGNGKGTLTFGWTAFKWATATATEETQEIECKIGLSQNQVAWSLGPKAC